MGIEKLSDKRVGRQVFSRGHRGRSPAFRGIRSSTGLSGSSPVKTPNHVGGRPSKQEFEVAPERRLTRGHVARMLGVHVSAVRRLEARGDLHPEIGAGGIRYFTIYELRDLQARRLSATRGRSAAMRLAAFEPF